MDSNLDRIISSIKRAEDEQNEINLRPKWLKDYIGQDKAKNMISVFIDAAKLRGQTLDHCLLYGPPGLGKTTLANIIANELGVNIRITSGPAIERAGDLASILTNMEKDDVLFIDEIHRLNRAIEEILYPAMEDYCLDIVIGKGPSARSVRLDLSRFTLIGATTRAGLLSTPLRDRFGVLLNLDLYDEISLTEIIMRSSKIMSVDIKESAAKEIARRSRGTPRIANRLLKRVSDYAIVNGKESIGIDEAKAGLSFMSIDSVGLDDVDRKILRIMVEDFGGRPVGIETIAVAAGEDSMTIEDVYEPFLIQCGFMQRTQRGRIVTKKGYEHMGFDFKE